MPNVQPGDVAFYVGPEHPNGPQRMQMCTVKGPVEPEYKLIGCCGRHKVLAPLWPGQVWTVEWANPIVVTAGQDLAMPPLSIQVAPEQDRYLRKLDGGITKEDIVAEGREIQEVEQSVAELNAKLQHTPVHDELGHNVGYLPDVVRHRILRDYREWLANKFWMHEMYRYEKLFKFGLLAAVFSLLRAEFYRFQRAMQRVRAKYRDPAPVERLEPRFEPVGQCEPQPGQDQRG